MYDINEVSALLHIHEKANAHGSLLKNIADAAMRELKRINEDHAPSAPQREAIAVVDEPEPEPSLTPLRREGL